MNNARTAFDNIRIYIWYGGYFLFSNYKYQNASSGWYDLNVNYNEQLVFTKKFLKSYFYRYDSRNTSMTMTDRNRSTHAFDFNQKNDAGQRLCRILEISASRRA